MNIFLRRATNIFLSILTVVSISLLNVFIINSYATTYSGSCGTNIFWMLDTATGNMSIHGTGDMEDYSLGYPAPWLTYYSFIKTVDISNGITSIGTAAFNDCSELTSIAIPNSVKSINDSAFYFCSALTNISIPESVTNFGSNVFEKTAWYNNQPNGLVYANKIAYKYKGSMPINTTIAINAETLVIAEGAFQNCYNLTAIVMPDTVINIGDLAFYGCSSLSSITIPDSVRSIGSSVFYSCTTLSTAYIGSSVESIGNSTFSQCTSLTNITIPDSMISIGKSAFNGCSGITNISIPENVTNIGEAVFSGCTAMKSISVDINNEYYSSENGVLYDKFKERLLQFSCGAGGDFVVPEGVRYIMNGAFTSSRFVANISLPDSVTYIGAYAFQNCTALEALIVPSSIVYMGNLVFSNNPLLKIYCIKDSFAHYYAMENSINYELIYLKVSMNGIDCVIDYPTKFITGLSSGISSYDDFFCTEPGYTVAFTPASNGFGTGTLVFVLKGNVVFDKYTAVLFGDVNGDGNIDSIDAGLLVDYENYLVNWDLIENAGYMKAGDLNGDNKIDSIDAGIIVDAENYLVTIDQKTGLTQMN